MKQVLEDYRTAAIDEKLRAMLGLLETFTLHPEQLAPDVIRPVLAAGVSREAIRDAFTWRFSSTPTTGWRIRSDGSCRRSSITPKPAHSC
jgi:hypothetical protein